MLECKLCHKFYKSITNSHLKREHKVTIKDYLVMFPNSVLSNRRGKSYKEFYGDIEAKELKERLSKSHIGIKQSEETKQKHKESMLGKNKGKIYTPRETRFCKCQCGESFKCLITSNQRYIACHQRRGKLSSKQGKTYEELYGVEKAIELKINRSNTQLGENNSNWQGGTSNESHSFDFNEELKESIRDRDDNTCQVCKLRQEQLDKTLSIHHIDYDKKNSSEDNLISLCNSCHSKTNGNREYWTKVFQQKIELRFCVVN